MFKKVTAAGISRSQRAAQDLALRRVVPKSFTVSISRARAEFLAEVMRVEGFDRAIDIVYAALDMAERAWRESHPKGGDGDSKDGGADGA